MPKATFQCLSIYLKIQNGEAFREKIGEIFRQLEIEPDTLHRKLKDVIETDNKTKSAQSSKQHLLETIEKTDYQSPGDDAPEKTPDSLKKPSAILCFVDDAPTYIRIRVSMIDPHRTGRNRSAMHWYRFFENRFHVRKAVLYTQPLDDDFDYENEDRLEIVKNSLDD